MSSREVYIDGVRYIPAKSAVVNLEGVARALLMEYWGTVTDEQLEKFMKSKDIFIIVTDYSDGDNITLSTFLDNLAEIL